MKHFLIFFFLFQLSYFEINSQSAINPGLDGKTLTSIVFHDNFTLILNTAEGVERLRPRGVNGFVLALNTQTGELLNSSTDDKGIYLKASDNMGNLILTRSAGAVVNIFAKKDNSYQVITPIDNQVGEIEIENETAYKSSDFESFSNGEYVILGPSEKRFKLHQKNKDGDEIEWILNKIKLDGLKSETASFHLKSKEGKQDETGHILLEILDDSFIVLSKTFSENKLKDANKQNLFISEFDFTGKLLNETNLSLTIDNTKYKFTNAFLERGSVRVISNGYHNVFTAAGTGTVYYNKEDNSFLICAILDGQSKNDKPIVLLTKKDANDNEIWKSHIDITSEKMSKYDIEDTEFLPIIVDDKIFYRKKDYSSRNEGGVITGVLDYKTGKLIHSTEITELKGITELDDTKGSFLYGRSIIGDLSENIILDPESILAYGTNDNVKNYFKSENPNSQTWYYSHINEDTSVTILKADYKNKVYRLFNFEQL